MFFYFGIIDIDEEVNYVNLCDNKEDYEVQIKKYKNVKLLNDFKSDLFSFLDNLKYPLEINAVIGKVKEEKHIMETLEFLSIDFSKKLIDE